MVCADLVLITENLFTPNENKSNPEDPLAVSIVGDKVRDVGYFHDLRAQICGKTKILKAQGGTVLPAFIDSHTHMLETGWRAGWIDLSKVQKLKDLLSILSSYAVKLGPGEWILGDSWDESRWEDERRFPYLSELDEACPDNPVYLRRIDGHIAVINSQALKLLKIPEDIPIVEKDKRGRYTGVIKEKAVEYAQEKLKKLQMDVEKALDQAFSKSVEKGVASVTEYINPSQLIAIMNYFSRKQRLYRVAAYVWIEYMEKLSNFNFKTVYRSSYIRFRGVKLMADGSLGARTAALREPYRDDPSNRGTLLLSREELETIVKKSDELGFQLAIHAIGDRAIDVVLGALKKSSKIRELRHRIEHFEVVREEHIELAKRHYVSISMQPNFVANWQHRGGLYERRLGWERAFNMNPFRSILENGIPLGFGSDCMPLDPLYGIYGAVTHPNPDEQLTIEEAIRAYTLGSAYLEGSESDKGSLERNKLADIVVLDRAISQAHPRELLQTRVLYTIIGGRLFNT